MPCPCDAGLGDPDGETQFGSVGRCGEGRVGAGRRAACVGMGWSEEAGTVALARAAGIGPDC